MSKQDDPPRKSAPCPGVPAIFALAADVRPARGIASLGTKRLVDVFGLDENGNPTRELQESMERLRQTEALKAQIRQRVAVLKERERDDRSKRIEAKLDILLARGNADVSPPATQPHPVTPSATTHNHITVEIPQPQCDRIHVDDVMEDDEVYIDLSRRGPKN